MRFLFFLLLCVQITYSQNQLQAALLDSTTKEPIEFADIYNNYNYTNSNADGSFLFTSESDSVFIKRLGYKPLRSTFNELQNKKIIFLTEETIALDEVVLTSEKSIFDYIKDSLTSNYPFSPYEERFTLRALLKKNDTILKLEDLSGKVKRQQLLASKSNPMPKKNYEIELLNMRKAGIKEDGIDFMLNDFHEIFQWFVSIAFDKEYFDMQSSNINDSLVKYEIKIKDSIAQHSSISSIGSYIVNSEDKAIMEAMREMKIPNAEFKKSGPYRYRTIYFRIHSFFEKGKKPYYYLKNSKLNLTAEVINNKTQHKDIYDCTYILTTQDNFKNLNTKKNASVKRDIFKLKYPYNPDFWEKQNQLLLTNEMLDFLSTVNAKDNEYRAISNLK